MIHKHFLLLYKGVPRGINQYEGVFQRTYLNIITRLITTPNTNSSEQVEFIKSATESSKSEPNWSNFKNNVLCKQGNLNEKNIDAVMLKTMVANKKFNAALSFANHLQLSNKELSIGAINSLLYLYYEYAKEYDLSEQDKAFILKTYTHLYEKYQVLDNATCERLLHALCAINEWRKCKKVLDDIQLTGTPTHSAYSTLIGTLFKNNKKAEAMKMIDISENNRRSLRDCAYDEWMKYIFRKYKDKKTVLKYLNELCTHISKNSTVVPRATANKLKESFESLNWNVQFTEIRKQSGQCKNCDLTLDCLRLSAEEFATLQQNVKDKLIVGSDLFLKTSPEELKKFMDLVENTGPYDIVLDALNVAYTAGKGGADERIRILTTVVNHFLQQKKKILLLGRKHMLNWKRGALVQLMKKTQYFFTENISQDDPYFITAAILSGPQTDIVSRDLLRGHRFLLRTDALRQLFQRWQWEHQWMVFPSTNRFRPIIQEPLKFTPIAQQHTNGWHLPYEAENTSLEYVNDGVPDVSSWLCITQKINNN
ncbi:mitochondrial ribonuclease P catalytic subunit isoform X2 [Bicyclus anynana]|uniref:Mitochondrial ribonuclease P catalytic subunit n=1 Tax=Bicyclus anynana TaxID=110368 RepID=A0A6J1NY58_BICAN|nr:mitochondrial ribonuclease P catalytic subunit isoform X2 [Bicyclus anynana]